MRRVSRIVVAGMPAPGHVNPSVPIAARLVNQGDEVVYYSTDRFREQIERAGAEFRAYPIGTLDAEDIAAATRSGSALRVVVRILRATETLLPFLRSELSITPADAVAFDSNALWGRMAATGAGLPRISLMTTFLLGTADLGGLTAREWLGFVRSSVADLPSVLAARRRLVRRFGKELYPPRPTLPMRGDLTIFPIPRELQPENPLLDESCLFVGPTADPATRAEVVDGELGAHLEGAGPVVLVSLGTLHQGSEEFFRACFRALADLPARVVIAVGSDLDPARLGPPPANTLVRASVPQLAVLRRAAVFVTHGGMNSALEGLAAGVPLVVVPQQVEQLIIGRTVAERGAAVVLRQHLSNRAVPPAELRAAVERALTDPAARQAAEAFGRTLSAGGGPAAAASAIRALLRRHHGAGTR